MPECRASSTPYWIIGLSTIGSISLGWALVAGRKRVPRPAAGNTALRTLACIIFQFEARAAVLARTARRLSAGRTQFVFSAVEPTAQPVAARRNCVFLSAVLLMVYLGQRNRWHTS